MPCYLPVMQFAQQQRAAPDAVPRLCHPRLRPGRRRPAAVRQHRADQRDPGPAPGRGELLGYANFGEVSVVPKMADSPAAGGRRSCATWPRGPGPMPSRTWPTCATSPRSELGIADPQAWDWPFIERKAQGSALRLQRAGGQAVLHRAQGAGRPVQDRRDACSK